MASRRSTSPPPHLAALKGPFSEQQWQKLISMLGKLEDFLKHMQDGYSGLPAPHQETHLVGGDDELAEPEDPTTIDAGSAADPGDGPSFAREDHEHAVTTGTAVALGEAEAEGSGVALARAAHVHKLAVRVAKNGVVVGTRKRLNFLVGSGGSITIDDDSSTDEVDITIGAADANRPHALPNYQDFLLARSTSTWAELVALSNTYI